MSERWKPVVGYEGLYEVSDQGNVRSLEREVSYKNRYGPIVKNLRAKELKPTIVTSGYLNVKLSRDGRVTQRLVHRLVLEAFEGTCPPGHQACHYDDDPSNNRLENLRWGTQSENEFDKVRNGNHHHARKTHCPQGHEYTAENTYRPPGAPNTRRCRTCARDRQRAPKTLRSAA